MLYLSLHRCAHATGPRGRGAAEGLPAPRQLLPQPAQPRQSARSGAGRAHRHPLHAVGQAASVGLRWGARRCRRSVGHARQKPGRPRGRSRPAQVAAAAPPGTERERRPPPPASRRPSHLPPAARGRPRAPGRDATSPPGGGSAAAPSPAAARAPATALPPSSSSPAAGRPGRRDRRPAAAGWVPRRRAELSGRPRPAGSRPLGVPPAAGGAAAAPPGRHLPRGEERQAPPRRRPAPPARPRPGRGRSGAGGGGGGAGGSAGCGRGRQLQGGGGRARGSLCGEITRCSFPRRNTGKIASGSRSGAGSRTTAALPPARGARSASQLTARASHRGGGEPGRERSVSLTWRSGKLRPGRSDAEARKSRSSIPLPAAGGCLG